MTQLNDAPATQKFAALEIDVQDAVGFITLSRPELLNRFDPLLLDEFVVALKALRSRPEVRAIVLASTGRVFSAGGDFALMQACHDDLAERMRALDRGKVLFDALFDVPLPIVAALHGDAYGLGANIVVSCDAVVASRTASMADSHVRIGLAAGDGCAIWPQAVGMLWAKRYLLSGDNLKAEDAFRLGLVTDLVDEPDDVLPAATALAQRFAALPPIAVQGTKRALNRLQKERVGEVLELSLANEGVSMATDDLLEAIDACRTKRAPTYQGR